MNIQNFKIGKKKKKSKKSKSKSKTNLIPYLSNKISWQNVNKMPHHRAASPKRLFSSKYAHSQNTIKFKKPFEFNEFDNFNNFHSKQN